MLGTHGYRSQLWPQPRPQPRTVPHSKPEMLFLPGRCGEADSWFGDHQAIRNMGSFRGDQRGGRGGWGGMDAPCLLVSMIGKSLYPRYEHSPHSILSQWSTLAFCGLATFCPSVSFASQQLLSQPQRYTSSSPVSALLTLFSFPDG